MTLPVLLAVLVLPAADRPTTLSLADTGRTSYRIVIRRGVTPPERRAADVGEQLQQRVGVDGQVMVILDGHSHAVSRGTVAAHAETGRHARPECPGAS